MVPEPQEIIPKSEKGKTPELQITYRINYYESLGFCVNK